MNPQIPMTYAVAQQITFTAWFQTEQGLKGADFLAYDYRDLVTVKNTLAADPTFRGITPAGQTLEK